MRVTVVGCGYLGAVHAAALASMGHEVVGIDVDAGKVAALSQGRAPAVAKIVAHTWADDRILMPVGR